MNKGLKIGLWIGIPIITIVSGMVLYVKLNRFQLINYNPTTKIAKLKVGFKEIEYKVEEGLSMMLRLSTGKEIYLTPAYANESEKANSLYGIYVKDRADRIIQTIYF